MIIGINATKNAIFIAETSDEKDQFEVQKVTRLQYELSGALELEDLFKTLKTLLAGFRGEECTKVAILFCSGGQYGSSPEAIKAEAIAELAAHESGFEVIAVKPQSLKAALGCGDGQKWQARSVELFNSDGNHKYWSQGANGAGAAAYKVAE